MKYSIFLNFKYLSMKMNWEKCKTNLLNVSDLQKISRFKWNNFVWIFRFLRKLTFNEHWISFFPVFISLMAHLRYILLLDVSIFTTIHNEKESKNQLEVFLKDFT